MFFLLFLILVAFFINAVGFAKTLQKLDELELKIGKLDKEELALEKFVTKKLDTVYQPKPAVTIVDADDPATIVKMEALERERKQHRGPNPDEQ